METEKSEDAIRMDIARIPLIGVVMVMGGSLWYSCIIRPKGLEVNPLSHQDSLSAVVAIPAKGDLLLLIDLALQDDVLDLGSIKGHCLNDGLEVFLGSHEVLSVWYSCIIRPKGL